MAKKNYVRVTLPEPCAEDWDKMKPNGCGKFCASCQKTVIDFSQMPDEYMARILGNNPTGLCGHFSEAQLNKPIEIIALPNKNSFLDIGKKIAAALLLLPTVAPNVLFAQKQKAPTTHQTVDKQNDGTISLQGIIKDAATQQALKGMLLKAEGLDTQTSDKDGKFTFTIPQSLVGTSIKVSAHYNIGSSDSVMNTTILDETVWIDTNAKVHHVTLLRLPVQVMTFSSANGNGNHIDVEGLRITERSTFTYSGAPMIEVQPRIAKRYTLWQRTKNIFKKKENLR